MTACKPLNAGAHQAGTCKQPGGGVVQPPLPLDRGFTTPAQVKANQASGSGAGYKAAAKAHGIPFRPNGLFAPEDELLQHLAAPDQWPFEKHLPGPDSPYQHLPSGGWITGDAAAARGIDLRLFYKEPAETSGSGSGSLVGAVRFGESAAIGVGFYLSAHGGAIETVLDEATAELAKIEFAPFLSTREATFSIRRPVPLHTTLLVRCRATEQRGIRCWVDGSIETADGGDVLATCKAQLVDMTHFL